MKKLPPVILIIILIFILTACQSNHVADSKQNPTSGASSAMQGTNASLPLINGYPQNILPLYQPYSLVSSGFSYRANDIYPVGKDIYTVTYESTALEQDLFKYYTGLLTENNAAPSPSESASPISSDEADHTATDSISGKIGDSGVQINFLDNGDNTTTVYLTLGLSKDKYVNANPFFTGYPAGLVDEYGVLSQQEVTYEEQYYGGKTVHYITVYLTGLTQQEFADYYKDKYASKPGFAQTPSDSRLSVSWQDQGFACSVSYTAGLSSYITIDASKAG